MSEVKGVLKSFIDTYKTEAIAILEGIIFANKIKSSKPKNLIKKYFKKYKK